MATRVHGEERVAITFAGRSGRAKVNRRRVWLSVAMEVEPRRDDIDTNSWRTHTLRYDYSLFGDERGSDEWLAYHFHPRTPKDLPHLHVNADAGWATRGLRRRHLPTGRVALEDVIQSLIEDFGVVPLKDAWRRDLDRNRRIYADRRTW